jgi:hypothetical protein
LKGLREFSGRYEMLKYGLLLGFALVLVGCGGPSTDDPAAMAKHVVSLVNDKQYDAAAGYFADNFWDDGPLTGEKRDGLAREIRGEFEREGKGTLVFKEISYRKGPDRAEAELDIIRPEGRRSGGDWDMVKKEGRWWFEK